MIETMNGFIHGIEDETITMLEVRNIFKAIDKGIINRIVYREDTYPCEERAFDISKIVRCKNCKCYELDKHDPGKGDCNGSCSNLVKVSDDWFCADGEQKEGG